MKNEVKLQNDQWQRRMTDHSDFVLSLFHSLRMSLPHFVTSSHPVTAVVIMVLKKKQTAFWRFFKEPQSFLKVSWFEVKNVFMLFWMMLLHYIRKHTDTNMPHIQKTTLFIQQHELQKLTTEAKCFWGRSLRLMLSKQWKLNHEIVSV